MAQCKTNTVTHKINLERGNVQFFIRKEESVCVWVCCVVASICPGVGGEDSFQRKRLREFRVQTVPG